MIDDAGEHKFLKYENDILRITGPNLTKMDRDMHKKSSSDLPHFSPTQHHSSSIKGRVTSKWPLLCDLKYTAESSSIKTQAAEKMCKLTPNVSVS